ncbi:hypothetical protein L484_015705 [Morus notabilis]|uniref:Uncharacterized protein n=1 Tax=Morus notabilis TaxID=981085 RepID=W9S0B8_9ROSA|nr:hypothetical protein L484_015705 [Morus notabilis]
MGRKRKGSDQEQEERESSIEIGSMGLSQITLEETSAARRGRKRYVGVRPEALGEVGGGDQRHNTEDKSVAGDLWHSRGGCKSLR